MDCEFMPPHCLGFSNATYYHKWSKIRTAMRPSAAPVSEGTQGKARSSLAQIARQTFKMGEMILARHCADSFVRGFGLLCA